jgi:Rrf2 family protein
LEVRIIMMLSTKGRYGVKAMYELAVSEAEAPLPLKDIARRQGLSPDYLEQLMVFLRRAGLVKSARGARGGYSLNMPASGITVGKIVRVMEGTIAPTECVGDGAVEHCGCAEGCVARGVWERVAKSVAEVLDSISLADLVEAHRKDARPEDQ